MKSSIFRSYMGTFYRNRLIFPSDNDNRSVSIDIETGVINLGEKLICTDEAEREKTSEYSAAIYVGKEKLFFIPKYQKQILIFDKTEQKQYFMEFDPPDRLKENAMRYWEYLIYGGDLFLFPFNANHILQIHLDTMKVESHTEVIKAVDSLIGQRAENYFASKVQCDERTVLLAGWSQNFIAKVDLTTMEYQMVSVENEGNEKGFRDITIFEDHIYIVNHLFHVFEYDADTFRLIRQILPDMLCCMVKAIQGALCFIPAFKDNYILMDTKQNSVLKIPYEKGTHLPQEEPWNYNHHLIESNDYYFVMPIHSDLLVSIEKKTGEIRNIPLRYDESVTKYIFEYRECVYEGQAFENGVSLGLNNFINNVYEKKEKYLEPNNVGEKIWLQRQR